MELTTYKLGEIIETFISGDWGSESCSAETPNEVYCVRGADIVPIKNNDFADVPKRYISNKSLATKPLQVGDLIIEKSGGSPSQSTGRIVYVSENLLEAKSTIVCSNFCTAFRVKEGWNPLYIYYYWQNLYNAGVFFNFEGKTSGIKNLQLDNALKAIEVVAIPTDQQDRIVASLSAIDAKITINRSINHNLPSPDRSSRAAEALCAA